EVQERSWESILKVKLPMFMVTATGDRIVDNNKVRAYLAPLFQTSKNRLMELETGHAVQLEQAEELSRALLGFIAAQKNMNATAAPA
nr:alpha/beta hydrolase [Acidobacteriota bacterium]